MTFANIALKNARKKFGSYLIYFFSTTFSVMIFHLFCSMYYNPSFEAYRFGTGKITVLFRGSAIAVLVFAAIFVLYSGSYFIKTQKKEIAIYSLLGMRKERIALMMFWETFFIGVLAVALGTGVGTASSGYFTALLMRFMAAGTSVTLAVSPIAILVTILAFTVLFVISGIKAYKTIYQYTLIDLLSAQKQSEGVPDFSPAGAGISLLLLASGYLISTVMNVNAGGMQLLSVVFIVLGCMVAGTYLLFKNAIPLFICLLKRRKPIYYKTSSFIGISQIAFRLKANAKMLCIAALLCASTITMISATYSLYKGLEDTVVYYSPYSYLAKNISDEQHDEICRRVSDIGEVHLTSDNQIELLKLQVQSPDYAVYDEESEPVYGAAVDAYMLSQSAYLRIIQETGAKPGEYSNLKTNFNGGLKDNEIYFLDGNAHDECCSALVGKNMQMIASGKVYSGKVAGAGLHKYIGLLDLYGRPSIVVSDAVYAAYRANASLGEIDTFYGFMFDDEMASERTVAAIDQIVPARFSIGGTMPKSISYVGFYKANFALYGPYVFIGLFLGVLFMLAIGSVLYYKLMMEAQEEAPRYEILRKIGMKKGEILASVAKQLGLVYGLPLLVGLIHTAFALFTYNRTMDLIGQETPTLPNAAMVVLIFVGVYGLFYALSVKTYHGIVWRRANGGKQ